MKKLKGKRILVTGGTGFIGSNLIRELLSLGSKVTIIKKPQSKSIWRVNDILGKLEVLEVDLRDAYVLRKKLKSSQHKIIFHLASRVDRRQKEKLTKELIENNFVSTMNLYDSFIGKGIERFVNTGTCDEYGDNKVPFSETQREKPLSPYALSKVFSTYYSDLMYKIVEIPTVTVRPFLTYGPYQTGEMLVPYVIESCLKSEEFKVTPAEQTRELLYVSDIVNGFIKAAVLDEAIGEVINLGVGKEYKIKDVIKLIVSLTGYEREWKLGSIDYRKDELFRFYCDGKKAKKILKWEPKILLEEGLLRTIDWYKNFLATKS